MKYFLDNLDRIGQLVSESPSPRACDACMRPGAAPAARAPAALPSPASCPETSTIAVLIPEHQPASSRLRDPVVPLSAGAAGLQQPRVHPAKSVHGTWVSSAQSFLLPSVCFFQSVCWGGWSISPVGLLPSPALLETFPSPPFTSRVGRWAERLPPC